jgi:hypothetical protein
MKMTLEATVDKQLDKIFNLLSKICHEIDENGFSKLGENYDEDYIYNTANILYHKVKVFHDYILNVPRNEIYCL